MKTKKVMAVILLFSLIFSTSLIFADDNMDYINYEESSDNTILVDWYCPGAPKHQPKVGSTITGKLIYNGNTYAFSKVTCKHCMATIYCVPDYTGFTYDQFIQQGPLHVTCTNMYDGEPIDWDTDIYY